ncbi:MAG: purine-binding chemotaxis protein CheW [Deltaproteobacteria bacterium]|nr:purine-binding chemotaxis protein CheW [Deltaproteobacteria bacterium]
MQEATMVRETKETRAQTETREYVTFGLNDEIFAIDALNVQEIIELANITRVPQLPEFLKGVINLRGTIIPVIDLKLKFGMSSIEYKKHTCIIVAEFSGGVMGLIVDAVSDVLNLSQEAISNTPSFGAKVKTDFIKGMAKVDNNLVIVLDVDKVLTSEETSVIAEAAASNVQ